MEMLLMRAHKKTLRQTQISIFRKKEQKEFIFLLKLVIFNNLLLQRFNKGKKSKIENKLKVFISTLKPLLCVPQSSALQKRTILVLKSRLEINHLKTIKTNRQVKLLLKDQSQLRIKQSEVEKTVVNAVIVCLRTLHKKPYRRDRLR